MKRGGKYLILFVIVLLCVLDINVSAVSLSILSPENKTYTFPQILINFSTSDSNGISSTWYNDEISWNQILLNSYLTNTVSEGETSTLNCDDGQTIVDYSSFYGVNCNSSLCGSCNIGETSCSVTFSNANCGEVCLGVAKLGMLNVSCSNNKYHTYHNFSDGYHNLLFFSNNTLGEYILKQVNFSIDSISPTFSNTSILPSCVYNYTNLTIKETVADINLDKIWVYGNWENEWKNYSVNCLSSDINNTVKTCGYSISSNFLQNGEILNWKFFANDTYGNTGESNLYEFNITKRTKLIISPEFSEPSGWYITMPTFTLENSDAESTFYRWDSRSEINYTGAFNQSTADYLIPVEKSGILSLNYWSKTSCGEEIPQNEIIKIDLTAPTYEKLYPKEGYIMVDSNQQISADILDVYYGNSGIDKQSIIMSINGNIVDSSLYTIDDDSRVRIVYNANLSDGLYIINLSSQDIAGNKRSEKIWNFTINSSAGFNLEIISPENRNITNPYKNKAVRIDINLDGTVVANERIDKIELRDNTKKSPKWVKLCSNCGYSYNKTKSFQEGWNNITIKATDIYGNIKEEDRLFFIDSKSPVISSTVPSRNKYTNGSNFYIKFREDNPKEVSVSFNPTIALDLSKCTESRSYRECYNDLNLTDFDGTYIEYWFNVSDYASSVTSKKTMIKVDTSSPTINNLNVSVIGRYVYFNMTILNENKDSFDKVEYIDNITDPKARWKSMCTSLKNNVCYKRVSLSYGSHNITIRSTDEAGNSDVENLEVNV